MWVISHRARDEPISVASGSRAVAEQAAVPTPAVLMQIKADGLYYFASLSGYHQFLFYYNFIILFPGHYHRFFLLYSFYPSFSLYSFLVPSAPLPFLPPPFPILQPFPTIFFFLIAYFFPSLPVLLYTYK